MLSKAGLSHACKVLYNSPLEFLHYSLHPDVRDQLLFGVYEFDYLFEKTEKTMKVDARRSRKTNVEKVDIEGTANE